MSWGEWEFQAGLSLRNAFLLLSELSLLAVPAQGHEGHWVVPEAVAALRWHGHERQSEMEADG